MPGLAQNTHGHFWLSDTPQVAGSKSWGSTFARTASWAKLLHRSSGRTLIFVNTHFDFQPTAVDGAARLMQQWLSQVQQDSPVVLTGDFNADKDSVAYLLLTDHQMRFDAYRRVHARSVKYLPCKLYKWEQQGTCS